MRVHHMRSTCLYVYMSIHVQHMCLHVIVQQVHGDLSIGGPELSEHGGGGLVALRHEVKHARVATAEEKLRLAGGGAVERALPAQPHLQQCMAAQRMAT